MIVTFNVEECQPLYGNFDFKTTDNEANFDILGGLRNLSGHGEAIESSYLMGTHGTRKTELRYNIPLVHYFQVDCLDYAYIFSFMNLPPAIRYP